MNPSDLFYLPYLEEEIVKANISLCERNPSYFALSLRLSAAREGSVAYSTFLLVRLGGPAMAARFLCYREILSY